MVKQKITHTEKGPFCIPSKGCQLWLVGRGGSRYVSTLSTCANDS